MDMGRYLIGFFIGLMLLLPLGIKWELEQKIVIPSALLITGISWSIIEFLNAFKPFPMHVSIALHIIMVFIISGGCILFKFYRDPERTPPKKENVILSPADGRIIYIKRINGREIPISEKNNKKFLLEEFVKSDRFPRKGFLVGIAMTFLDVHVNRSPISGKIKYIKHIKGLFLSLKKKEAVIQNERLFTIIENKSIKLGVVQIASRLVRNIVPYLKEGSEVEIGQRIGMIRFGSQVDLLIPGSACIEFMVQKGDKIKAGSTIIATY